jgi:shikimate kinase
VENRVILIMGSKHSGKNLCAKALKEIIGGEAVNLDELVEKQTGKTPRELFSEGHDFFKKAEVRALTSVIQGHPPQTEGEARFSPGTGTSPGVLIITAGGGIIDNDEAMALLLEAKVPSADRQLIIVYLEISAETAWQRILDGSNDGNLPPLINTNNPKETHLALHNRRAKAYKAVAGITVFTENKSPEEIAREIAEHLISKN